MARMLDVEAAIDAKPLSAAQIAIAAVCALTIMLDGFDNQSIAFVAPEIVRLWNLPLLALGPVFSAGLFGGLFGGLAIGPISAKLGPKRALVGTVILFAAASLATTLAQNATQLITMRLVTGLGLGAAIPNLLALTAEYMPRRQRSMIVTAMFCCYPLGAVVGGLVIAPIVASSGWQIAFILGGLAPLFLLPALLLAVPESAAFLIVKGKDVSKILTRLGVDTAGYDQFSLPPRASENVSPLRLLSDAPWAGTICLWITCFLGVLLAYVLVNWTPTLMKSMGFSLESAVHSGVVINLGAVLAGLVLGRLIDKRGPFGVIRTAFLIGAPFIALIGIFQSHALIMVAIFCAGFFSLGAQMTVVSLATSFYSANLRTTGVGFCLAAGRIGSVVGPIGAGVILAGGAGASLVFQIGGIVSLLAALTIFLMGRLSSITVAPESAR